VEVDVLAPTIAAPIGGPPPSVGAPPLLPDNNFTFGKLKRNLDKGTARLEVIVPGSGELRLQSKRLKGLQQSAESTGTVTLKLKTKRAGYARRRLERRAELQVKPKVTYVPNGGDALRKTKPVKLRMRP
jgi:hypothetical protein